jgi:hypothetical protein
VVDRTKAQARNLNCVSAFIVAPIWVNVDLGELIEPYAFLRHDKLPNWLAEKLIGSSWCLAISFLDIPELNQARSKEKRN